MRSPRRARERVRRGALWLDVRYPSEYQYDKLPGAINVPLAEVRNTVRRARPLAGITCVYCQSGAAQRRGGFPVAQRGFKVVAAGRPAGVQSAAHKSGAESPEGLLINHGTVAPKWSKTRGCDRLLAAGVDWR